MLLEVLLPQWRRSLRLQPGKGGTEILRTHGVSSASMSDSCMSRLSVEKGGRLEVLRGGDCVSVDPRGLEQQGTPLSQLRTA
jgi:hypothetical protein